MFRVRLINHSKSRALLLMTAAVLSFSTLSGCSYFQNRHHIVVGAVPDDYRTNHPIVLSERDEMLDVPVASSDTHISVAQRSSIQGFVAQYASSGSGFVQILLPTGSVNAAAAQRVHSDIAAALRKGGVPPKYIVTATYDAQSAESSAPVRITYRAMSAATEPCGKWGEDLGDTSENKNYGNFGCASQNNLAAMVANPADLLGPRVPTPIDPVKRSLAISKYQKAAGSWSTDTDFTW